MGRPRVEHQWSKDGAESKYCGTCTQWKPVTGFNRESHRWDGLNPKCRDCGTKTQRKWISENPTKTAEYSRTYKTRHADRAKASKAAYRATEHGQRAQREYDTARYYADVAAGRARTVAWRETNPDKVEQQRQRRLGHYSRDPDRYRAQRAEWRENNRDRDRATLAAWRKDNLASVRQAAIRMAHKRRSLKLELPNEPWTEQQIVDRDGQQCWMCARPLGGALLSGRRDWDVDHLIPLAKPYPDHPGDTLSNLALACAPCNSWKNAKLLPAAVARYEQNVRLAASA